MDKRDFRWADHLEQVKYFWDFDDYNAICATLRPLPDMSGMYNQKNPFKIRYQKEMNNERHVNEKLYQKRLKIETKLKEMAPNLFYSSLPKLAFFKTVRLRGISNESMEEEIRETNNLRAIYQVDLDVPPIPLEGNNLTSHISPDTEIIPIKKTQKEENTNKLNHSHPLNYIPTQLPTNLIDPSMSIFNTNPNLPSYFPKTLISGNINKPVNYQTEACRNFHSQTGCSHGDNCHFIHDFAFEGRPIPNLEEWRRTNPNRITNLKKMREMQMGAASYYPPHTYFQG